MKNRFAVAALIGLSLATFGCQAPQDPDPPGQDPVKPSGIGPVAPRQPTRTINVWGAPIQVPNDELRT